MSDVKVYESVEAWKKEGARRFGEDIMKWKFKCPMCGHVSTVEEFKEVGADSPDCAYEECIGRYTGKGSPKYGDSTGCNWCAYGLFGIPKGGVKVTKEDGTTTHIFDFAEEGVILK